MECELKGGRLFLSRSSRERDPLTKRLGRIEGQVRGLRQMIEDDRYCGDELQLAEAILAATREVMRLLLSQHIDAAIDHMSDRPDAKSEIMNDVKAVLRPLMKEQ